jgi:hypothetical protein
MNRKIIFLLLIVLLASHVLALGVTPGKRIFEYEVGSEKSGEFSVFNSDKEDVKLIIVVEGELAEYISVSEDEFSMSASEESRSLSYAFEIPRGLKPGNHLTDIKVLQLPDDEGEEEVFIGAIVGVVTQVNLFVPFPGKFIEAKVNVLDEEEEISFVIPVFGRGEQDIESIRAKIDIHGLLNEKIASLETNEAELKSGERKDLSVVWDVSEVDPGPYLAVAQIDYDGGNLVINREFTVGKKVLNLVGIGVENFVLGEIAKLDMIVESGWKETLNDVYAEMIVYDDFGEELSNIKSANYEVPPGKNTLMEAFWDTEGIVEGIYDVSLSFFYEDEVDQYDLGVDVRQFDIKFIGTGYVISEGGSKGSGNLVTILIVVIGILALMNLSWFLYFRKKFNKK